LPTAVVTATARHEVVAAEALDPVVAAPGHDQVGPAGALEGVRRSAADPERQ
jgi:hypothetical protein